MPAWWCRNPHMQTLWPFFFRRYPKPKLTRSRLDLPDGDFLDLDWSENPGGPLVIILHGLEGSAKSHYARGMIAACLRRGWQSVIMHFRGCGGTPNRKSRGYHSGETGDLSYFIKYLAAQHTNRPIAVIGYSLGGNVLLKWLGEQGDQNYIKAAAAISVPMRLDICATRMHQGFSQFYERHLVACLCNNIKRNARTVTMPINLSKIDRLRSLWKFDEEVTAPLHGFESAKEYYRKSSAGQYLKKIRTETLIIHALDDPFMTPEVIPPSSAISPFIAMELCQWRVLLIPLGQWQKR